MTPFDPPVWLAFLAGVGFGLILNRMLRLAVDTRFRLSRWVSSRRRVPLVR